MFQNGAESIVLDKIRDIDVTTYNRFIERNGFENFDITEGWKVVEMLTTKPEGKMQKLKSRKSVGQDYDMSKIIPIMVSTQQIIDDGQVSGVRVGDGADAAFFPADKAVVKLMRAILKLSITKNETVYKAYEEVFNDILHLGAAKLGTTSKLTAQEVISKYEYIAETGNILNSSIAKGIVEAMQKEISLV